MNLPAVTVAQHGHVQQAQRLLDGIFYFGGQQNRASARAENSFVFGGKFLDRFVQAFFLQELQLRGAFATRQNQAIAIREIFGGAHLRRFDAHSREHRRVGREVSLHRENSNLHRLNSLGWIAAHHPRVDSRSFSSSWRTSRPRMASPSSSWASTTAFARASGSLDLKIPEPTNTASAPRRRTSAASAGVAIPPAEKFGTGSLPVFAIWRIRSIGAPSSFAWCINSSSRMVVRRFIWLTIVRM